MFHVSTLLSYLKTSLNHLRNRVVNRASASSNLPHNKNPRLKLGLQDRARFTTNWDAHGKMHIPPHYWLEYMRCCNQRQLDVVDILHASAMRDAEAHDSSFSSFYWNTSQNASKEKHRSAVPGIAGCITPGGECVRDMLVIT